LRGRDARDPSRITFAQLRVLSALDGAEGSRVGDLAEGAGISPASVTGGGDTLEQMGMITRLRSQSDRRVVLARLTDAGRATRDERRREVRGAFERALADLDPDELAAAPRVLRLLAGAMDAM
jgi:DNA-binding MarR family transcriptional regulator